MALTPQLRAGSAADTVRAAHLKGLPKSTRKRRETGSDYERARIEEISRRVELYQLRVQRLRSELLNRSEVEREYAVIVSAIKQGIMQSRLSKKEKEEIFANILTVEQFAAHVTQKQTADSGQKDKSPVIGNGGIDHAL